MEINPLVRQVTEIRRQRLFIDLDGVGADFDRGYYNLFGHWPWEVDDDTMWANIRGVDGFFANLPVMEGFLDAIAEFVACGYDPMFLTACPEHDYQGIADQKHAWVHKNVPFDILTLPVIKGKNKARFVQNEGDVLVDDFEKNLGPWENAGGIPILHKSWADSLPRVHQIMRLGKWRNVPEGNVISPRAPG